MTVPKEILNFFADFIRSELGIVYSDSNYFQLEKRLKDTAKQLGLASVEDLWAKAKDRLSDELKLLILDIATNNETSFFRDPAVFEGIKKLVLEDQIAGGEGQEIRIWSAASSTGQEVYSLAMALEEIREKKPGLNYRILATDYSQRVLGRAKDGIYTQLEVQRGLPASMLIKNFERSNDAESKLPATWKIKSHLRSRVEFQQLNLLGSFSSLPMFDLILCRNVLIYQTIERKKEIIKRMLSRLSDGGFFILGAAETIVGLDTSLEHVSMDRAVFYRKSVHQLDKTGT